MCKSIRSRSGPETFARYFWIANSLHVHSFTGSVKWPQGHPCVAILPLTLTAPKPTNPPKTLAIWGDHIKKRRLELGLYQKEVAMKLGVDECTITNWELNRTSPQLRFIPKIIEFLGYVPPLDTARTLGEIIVEYRRTRGLSQREFAEQMGLDPTTLSRWERGLGRPSKALQAKLAR